MCSFFVETMTIKQILNLKSFTWICFFTINTNSVKTEPSALHPLKWLTDRTCCLSIRPFWSRWICSTSNPPPPAVSIANFWLNHVAYVRGNCEQSWASSTGNETNKQKNSGASGGKQNFLPVRGLAGSWDAITSTIIPDSWQSKTKLLTVSSKLSGRHFACRATGYPRNVRTDNMTMTLLELVSVVQ